MLMGFNNDVGYRGLTVHVQTEDHGLEGKKGKKITTQVFRSGAILESITLSYADEIEGLEGKEREDIIKKKMKTMHKQAFINIKNGKYDERLGLPPREATEDAKKAEAKKEEAAETPEEPPKDDAKSKSSKGKEKKAKKAVPPPPEPEPKAAAAPPVAAATAEPSVIDDSMVATTGQFVFSNVSAYRGFDIRSPDDLAEMIRGAVSV